MELDRRLEGWRQWRNKGPLRGGGGGIFPNLSFLYKKPVNISPRKKHLGYKSSMGRGAKKAEEGDKKSGDLFF